MAPNQCRGVTLGNDFRDWLLGTLNMQMRILYYFNFTIISNYKLFIINALIQLCNLNLDLYLKLFDLHHVFVFYTYTLQYQYQKEEL